MPHEKPCCAFSQRSSHDQHSPRAVHRPAFPREESRLRSRCGTSSWSVRDDRRSGRHRDFALAFRRKPFGIAAAVCAWPIGRAVNCFAAPPPLHRHGLRRGSGAVPAGFTLPIRGGEHLVRRFDRFRSAIAATVAVAIGAVNPPGLAFAFPPGSLLVWTRPVPARSARYSKLHRWRCGSHIVRIEA